MSGGWIPARDRSERPHELVRRGFAPPRLLIVDGAPGLETALAGLWSEVPIQRCHEEFKRRIKTQTAASIAITSAVALDNRNRSAV